MHVYLPVQAVQSLGSSCHLPGSFQSPLVASLLGHRYVDAVRAAIVAGGDQASRSMVVGALMGAEEGAAGVPADWQSKVHKLAELKILIEELLKMRFEVIDV
jgi:ADP-ribosylglycohydrolase